MAINGRSDDIGLPPSKLFIDNGSNHNKQSTVYNLKLHRQNEAWGKERMISTVYNLKLQRQNEA